MFYSFILNKQRAETWHNNKKVSAVQKLEANLRIEFVLIQFPPAIKSWLSDNPANTLDCDDEMISAERVIRAAIEGYYLFLWTIKEEASSL